MLRSQAGVENVEDPYGNLKKGRIQLTPKKDAALDLARLVQFLEKDAGFEPVTEVTLEMHGKLMRRSGKLTFEVSGSGQTFAVAKVEGTKPPEEALAATSGFRMSRT